MARVTCPWCAAKVDIPEGSVGQMHLCTECHKLIVLHGGAGAPAASVAGGSEGDRSRPARRPYVWTRFIGLAILLAVVAAGYGFYHFSSRGLSLSSVRKDCESRSLQERTGARAKGELLGQLLDTIHFTSANWPGMPDYLGVTVYHDGKGRVLGIVAGWMEVNPSLGIERYARLHGEESAMAGTSPGSRVGNIVSARWAVQAAVRDIIGMDYHEQTPAKEKANAGWYGSIVKIEGGAGDYLPVFVVAVREELRGARAASQDDFEKSLPSFDEEGFDAPMQSIPSQPRLVPPDSRARINELTSPQPGRPNSGRNPLGGIHR
jgi:hypothetical protein